MKYAHFSGMPMKGRICWIQEKLVKFGYLNENSYTPYKRDKVFIKALMKFQSDCGMTPNADITESLFEKLNCN